MEWIPIKKKQKLKFFNQKQKSRLGDFQFGILPKSSSNFCCLYLSSPFFVTLASLCKSFNHLAFLLWFTDSTQMVPENFLDSLESGWTIILEHFALAKPYYLFLIPPNFCCNNYYPLFQFFSDNTHCFYSNIIFLSNVCHCFTLLTCLSFDDSIWLKSFLSFLILTL